jgi:hypothetical protein
LELTPPDRWVLDRLVLDRLDRLVRDYGCFDMMYEAYDPSYINCYPPDLAQAIAAELAFVEEAAEREAAKQDAAKKTRSSTHSGE